MTPDLQALGLRWTGCAGFSWQAGMSAYPASEDYTGRWRLYRVPGSGILAAAGEVTGGFVAGWEPYVAASPKPVIPDLEDPATLGCLLADVRRAWGVPIGIRCRTSGEWQVLRRGSELSICTAPSEAEALICAREAAP